MACTWRAGPSQLRCRVGLGGSDRDVPRFTARSRTQRARAYFGAHLTRRSMEGVRSVRRNPNPQVSVLTGVPHGRRSPAPSGQSVRRCERHRPPGRPGPNRGHQLRVGALMLFKRVHDSQFAATPTWGFGVNMFYVG